jgi:hypothetical protein
VDAPLRTELKALFEVAAAPRALAHRHWSIAHGRWRREIEGRVQVRFKKYVYVVRPLLSLAWVVQHKRPPPMTIGDLLTGSDMRPAPRR